ncbi:MAG: PfkB family carbohydrate kinase [Candidatus Pacebacteria bacterium]|nr:PfkB family carbohydrate kinase [Candidatus Paceibacterota bacterium]MDD5357242.1 PfkB family carbohydrate kinase [Candidatus Paceibacterota bacterium]
MFSKSHRQNKILVSGSLAIDLIFDIHGKIQNEIVMPIESQQNMMFVAKRKIERYGGTGGNIAYGLGLLGAKPILVSAVGKDFDNGFRKHLLSNGVIPKVFIDKNGFTANFYGMSDEKGQQVGVWQPNCYHEVIEKFPLSKIVARTVLATVSHAIVSAGTGKSMLSHTEELRKLCGKEITIIFDPGQVLSVFYDKTLLEKTLKLADIFIGNEVEFKQAESILGYSREEIFKLGVATLIETKGSKGSIVYHKDGAKEKVSAVKPKKIVGTTGAGDAYRSGLLFGLSRGQSLRKSCELGAKIAAKSIEYSGAQEYKL